MESPIHSLGDLFRQLGLPDDSASIEDFIATHRPLPAGVALADAPFWARAKRSSCAKKSTTMRTGPNREV
jgi:hypothetical protein